MHRQEAGAPRSTPERARAERNAAVERVLAADDVRQTIREARLPPDAVRDAVAAGFADHAVGVEEEQLAVAADSLHVPRSRLSVALPVQRAVGVVTALVTVLSAVIALAQSLGSWTVLATLFGIVLALFAVALALRQWVSLRSNESAARRAVASAEARARRRLDADVERRVFQAINDLAQTRFSCHLRPLDTKGLEGSVRP